MASASRKIFVVVFLIFSLCIAHAHQPRLVSESFNEVRDPEISQAFYAELKGKPDVYRIESDMPFVLYIGILVPDLEGIDRDVSAEITLEPYGEHEHEIVLLNSSSVEWTQYYEEFAGDSYYKGPEFEQEVGPGIYEIRVSSPDNYGKYVLVVGRKEVFTLGDTIDTILTLPGLKQDFFEKPFYTAYFNLIGIFLFISLLLILAAAFLLFRLFRRHKKGLGSF
jgi:hypothetical protein